METKYIYTSLELSKKLEEVGCELESEYWYCRNEYSNDMYIESGDRIESYNSVPLQAYDIMNDICIKYKIEFFGKEPIGTGEHYQNPWMPHDEIKDEAYIVHSHKILELMQEGKKPEAEEYIWENTIFNKKED